MPSELTAVCQILEQKLENLASNASWSTHPNSSFEDDWLVSRQHAVRLTRLTRAYYCSILTRSRRTHKHTGVGGKLCIPGLVVHFCASRGKRVSDGHVALAPMANRIFGKPSLPDLHSTLCGVKQKDFCIRNCLIRVIR